jgi:hypothetical protein
VTLTLELAELRDSNEQALAELSRASEERFGAELAEIENFLLSLYRFAVLSVKHEREIKQAAGAWRETLAVIDSSARRVQSLANERGAESVYPYLDRILEIRSAASDMLSLYE